MPCISLVSTCTYTCTCTCNSSEGVCFTCELSIAVCPVSVAGTHSVSVAGTHAASLLPQEKMKGRNKLVPRLLGITRESIMRVDENTKEVLKTWPLTTVRRWAASPNSFTLVCSFPLPPSPFPSLSPPPSLPRSERLVR